MNKQRLRKLAKFLDTLEPEKFDIGETVSEADDNYCGTVCCAIGWTPKIFPRLVKWDYLDTIDFLTVTMRKPNEYNYRNRGWVAVAEELFELNYRQTCELFTGAAYASIDYRDVTPKMVADKIRLLIKNNGEIE